MSASGKTLPEHDAKIARISFGLFGHITSVSLKKRLITDLMLAKFPVVLGQGILLFSRHVLAEAPIKSREKVDLKANQRIEIAL